ACPCFSLLFFFFFSSRRRHTRSKRDWSSDVCSSDLPQFFPDFSSQFSEIFFPSFPPDVFLPVQKLRRYSQKVSASLSKNSRLSRSEERRVGKECRSRWWLSVSKRKKSTVCRRSCDRE